MNGRIAQLHNTYRLMGQTELSADLRDRLDRIASQQVASAVSGALTELFGGEQTVYVLRNVNASLWLRWQTDVPDLHLAQRWGQQLAGDIVRHIAHDVGDGHNLVRFDNQAHFVASFIRDLLDGRVWDKWFYGAFHPYRETAVDQTLRQILHANRSHLSAILHQLADAELLEPLLSVLNPASQQELWRDGLKAAPLLDLDGLRALWQTACQLLEQAGLWPHVPPNSEALWQAYIATLPFSADWREKRSLAAAVCAIVQFLSYEARPLLPSDDATFQARLQQATQRLAWLDHQWLYERLNVWFRQTPAAPLRPIRPVTTPRQQAILDDLLTLLQARAVRLEMDQPDSAANALRLYTALISHAPRWEGDEQATALIARLLNLCQLWAQLPPAASPVVLADLRQGQLNAALSLLDRSSGTTTSVLTQQLRRLGRSGTIVLAALLAAAKDTRPSRMGNNMWQGVHAPRNVWQPTAFAGVFLLLRACLDLRLPALVQKSGWPAETAVAPLPALLLALGQRLVGAAPDAGLALLAGLEQLPTDWDANWEALSAADDERFQSALWRGMLALRLLQPESLFLYELALDGRTALIGADRSGQVAAFGSLLDGEDTQDAIVAGWLAVWQDAFGQQPTLVDAQMAAQDESLSAVYSQGKDAVEAGIEAMAYGRLGLPQADLTISLLAIALLRLWGRWLRHFATSTPAYLLHQFVHRSGAVRLDNDAIVVALEPRPLDMILDMAGYLAPLEHLSWIPHRQIDFRLGVPL